MDAVVSALCVEVSSMELAALKARSSAEAADSTAALDQVACKHLAAATEAVMQVGGPSATPTRLSGSEF